MNEYLYRLRISRIVVLLALVAGLLLAGWQTAAAQDGGEAATAPAVEEAPAAAVEPATAAVTATVPAGAAAAVTTDNVTANDVTANDVNDVAREFGARCAAACAWTPANSRRARR